MRATKPSSSSYQLSSIWHYLNVAWVRYRTGRTFSQIQGICPGLGLQQSRHHPWEPLPVVRDMKWCQSIWSKFLCFFVSLALLSPCLEYLIHLQLLLKHTFWKCSITPCLLSEPLSLHALVFFQALFTSCLTPPLSKQTCCTFLHKEKADSWSKQYMVSLSGEYSNQGLVLYQFLWNDHPSAFLGHLSTGWHGPLSTHILTWLALHFRSKACWWDLFSYITCSSLNFTFIYGFNSIICFPSCGLFLPNIYQDFYGFLCVRHCI